MILSLREEQGWGKIKFHSQAARFVISDVGKTGFVVNLRVTSVQTDAKVQGQMRSQSERDQAEETWLRPRQARQHVTVRKKRTEYSRRQGGGEVGKETVGCPEAPQEAFHQEKIESTH